MSSRTTLDPVIARGFTPGPEAGPQRDPAPPAAKGHSGQDVDDTGGAKGTAVAPPAVNAAALENERKRETASRLSPEERAVLADPAGIRTAAGLRVRLEAAERIFAAPVDRGEYAFADELLIGLHFAVIMHQSGRKLLPMSPEQAADLLARVDALSEGSSAAELRASVNEQVLRADKHPSLAIYHCTQLLKGGQLDAAQRGLVEEAMARAYGTAAALALDKAQEALAYAATGKFGGLKDSLFHLGEAERQAREIEGVAGAPPAMQEKRALLRGVESQVLSARIRGLAEVPADVPMYSFMSAAELLKEPARLDEGHRQALAAALTKLFPGCLAQSEGDAALLLAGKRPPYRDTWTLMQAVEAMRLAAGLVPLSAGDEGRVVALEAAIEKLRAR